MPCVTDISICSPSQSCPAAQVQLQILPQVATNTTLLNWDLTSVVAANDLQLPVQVQVEVSHAGVDDSAAWTIARPYAANTNTYNDSSQRVFGNDDNLYYRLAIQDAALSIYRSTPVRAGVSLPPRVVPLYREALRRWEGRARRGELRAGYLLKRIRWGSYCTNCRDRDSGVQIKSRCLICYDTGFTGGYYLPVECFYGVLGPYSVKEPYGDNRSFFQEGPSGTLQFMDIPVVYPGDIWVEKATDIRYYLGNIISAQRFGNVKLIATAECRQIDFSDVVYRFNVRQ